MFAIYITTEALAKIIKSRNEQWLSIINKQNKIYVDKEVNGETASIRTGTSPKPTQDKQDDVISSSLQSIICELEYSPLIKRLTDKSNWHEVLDVNPCGLYIIDVTKPQAEKIQKQYGVICLSAIEENLPEVPECLIAPTKTIFGVKEGKGWERFKELGEKVPSNTLIIQDRYFFEYHNDDWSNIDTSYSNFRNIIECFLPPEGFKGVFHLMLIVDWGHIDRRTYRNLYRFYSSVTHLTNDRGYEILFEILSIPQYSYKYDATHNRTIISNYYSISAEHQIRAFSRTSPLEYLVDQGITCRFLYSSTTTKSSDFWSEEDLGDSSEVSHKKWIENFQSIILKAVPLSGTYNEFNPLRYDNGNVERPPIEYTYYKNNAKMTHINIENRFFSLKNGEKCIYLTITNNNNWNDIHVLDGVYHAQYYKNCIVAAKSPSGQNILNGCMDKIKSLFEDRRFIKAEEGDESFYRIIVSNQCNIRTLTVKPSNSQEELIEQLKNYPENCFKMEHDAQMVANEIANICGFAPPYPNTRSNS